MKLKSIKKKQTPSIGRIVVYKTTLEQKEVMKANCKIHNIQNVRDELPAVIVCVQPMGTINLKIFLDGYGDDLWMTHVWEGDKEGQWHWPEIK